MRFIRFTRYDIRRFVEGLLFLFLFFCLLPAMMLAGLLYG